MERLRSLDLVGSCVGAGQLVALWSPPPPTAASHRSSPPGPPRMHRTCAGAPPCLRSCLHSSWSPMPGLSDLICRSGSLWASTRPTRQPRSHCGRWTATEGPGTNFCCGLRAARLQAAVQAGPRWQHSGRPTGNLKQQQPPAAATSSGSNVKQQQQQPQAAATPSSSNSQAPLWAQGSRSRSPGVRRCASLGFNPCHRLLSFSCCNLIAASPCPSA